MFENSCCIENSQAAREWLEILGYNISSIFENRFIKTTTYGKDLDYHFKNWIYSEEVIDCTGNLPLFKALTAVRDDSDYMQCFKRTGEDVWVLCQSHKFIGAEYISYHKSTKEELIERFKN